MPVSYNFVPRKSKYWAVFLVFFAQCVFSLRKVLKKISTVSDFILSVVCLTGWPSRRDPCCRQRRGAPPGWQRCHYNGNRCHLDDDKPPAVTNETPASTTKTADSVGNHHDAVTRLGYSVLFCSTKKSLLQSYLCKKELKVASSSCPTVISDVSFYYVYAYVKYHCKINVVIFTTNLLWYNCAVQWPTQEVGILHGILFHYFIMVSIQLSDFIVDVNVYAELKLK